MIKYAIKNWNEFQHYKDGRPVHWIKLHNTLLTDFKFGALSEASQLHLIKLWLLASKDQGRLEGDHAYYCRMLGAKKIDLKGLEAAGFLIRTDSYGQESIPYDIVPREEKRREEETKINGRFAPPSREDVSEYINSKNYHVNPDKFMSHYESNGWKVGRNSMKDWEAAIRSWEARDNPKTITEDPLKGCI